MDDSSSEEYVSADEGLDENLVLSPVRLSPSSEPYLQTNNTSITAHTRISDFPVESEITSSVVPVEDTVLAHNLEVSASDVNTCHRDNMNFQSTDTADQINRTVIAGSSSSINRPMSLETQDKDNAPLPDNQTSVQPPENEAPVPPPRRKRKKKMNKQPSLENLTDCPPETTPTHPRSMTVSSVDLKREFKRNPKKIEPSQEPELMNGCRTTAEPLVGEEDTTPVEVKSKPLAVLDHSSRASRSATPIPAISIEPNISLELTEDMLSGQDSEVVTSDTPLAKARGSNDTNTGLIIASDVESIDGELLFAESEDYPDEGGVDSKGESSPGTKRMSSPESPPSKDTGEGSSSPDQSTATHSDSDNAILESTMIKNLDTGEVIPLSAARDKIPQGTACNPLSEHLIRRTIEKAEAEGRPTSLYEDDDSQQRRKPLKKKLMKFKWGKRRDRDGAVPLSDEAVGGAQSLEDQHTVKYKQSSHKQGKQEFDKVRLKQDLTGTHLGAIWAMEFSICGRLLATAGQDSVVRVWVLTTAYSFFHELQAQYQRLGVHSSVDSLSEKASVASSSSKSSEEDDTGGSKLPFQDTPLCSYYGHTADVLDITWSKNFFLLSGSMDKTVRLWHISRKECLCCFQHVDFVTAIAFHPRDDRYFLSGSLDGKLRLWNIPDKRVALWNEIEGVGSHLITAANFCMNGKLAVVGTYDGRCIFYETEHLKYHTQIHVKSRHGKNKGRKISGVEPLPGEDKLLVTSNDSRVRLYNLKDHELSCKYKGCLNTSSQIKATFSRDGQYMISGSEDNYVYVWKTHLDVNKLSSIRRDRNEFYESFSSHSAPVTAAVFAPVPGITVDEGLKEVGEMVVAADYQGCIKIYVSGEKL